MTVRPRTGRRLAVLGILAGLMLICWRAWAQAPRRLPPIKPPPAYPNVRYGPHDRNVLDVWRARPDPGPTRRARRWSCSSTAAGSGRGTSRASPPGWS